jgi:hypothetical protein
MLSGWINVIVSVHGGKFKEAKAWWREEDQSPFLEASLSASSIVAKKLKLDYLEK